MPIVSDIKRKIAFSNRLKDKKAKPKSEVEMPPELMQAFRKLHTTARIALGNLHSVIAEPSKSQIQEIDLLLAELGDAIQEIRQSWTANVSSTNCCE